MKYFKAGKNQSGRLRKYILRRVPKSSEKGSAESRIRWTKRENYVRKNSPVEARIYRKLEASASLIFFLKIA
ncbi:hypothetical protein CH371_07155 [Leptospira wolffii]|uniref:Uncharacterized protein n=1 Tax=Leptospira wolffii TaxID=409998 RepID=A0A2M9ZH61_9LEPT|nr:hypothetical protein CH371_07155 [Leptospira wolffii]